MFSGQGILKSLCGNFENDVLLFFWRMTRKHQIPKRSPECISLTLSVWLNLSFINNENKFQRDQGFAPEAAAKFQVSRFSVLAMSHHGQSTTVSGIKHTALNKAKSLFLILSAYTPLQQPWAASCPSCPRVLHVLHLTRSQSSSSHLFKSSSQKFRRQPGSLTSLSSSQKTSPSSPKPPKSPISSAFKMHPKLIIQQHPHHCHHNASPSLGNADSPWLPSLLPLRIPSALVRKAE